jgi:hypothetical protein
MFSDNFKSFYFFGLLVIAFASFFLFYILFALLLSQPLNPHLTFTERLFSQLVFSILTTKSQEMFLYDSAGDALLYAFVAN